ncbi:hypothetical protein HD884_002137 [Ochrobactrum intermedium]|uniref:hypothetical protein n=1 Tax=Brucella intermedia TaxID=94625 RepID=UPI0015C8487B|nr:hypothetical protein [Brucella intermedia]NYD82074.1 hypothetical protein [Brucella intermedia]
MDITSGYTALTTAFNLAKGLKDVHDQVKVNEVLIELQAKILEAQEAVRDGRDRLEKAELELKGYKDWDLISSRYSLRDFGGNTYAYEVKKDHANGQPWHLACPDCYGNHRLSILQYDDIYVGRKNFKCSSCKNEFRLGKSEYYEKYTRVAPDWDVF